MKDIFECSCVEVECHIHHKENTGGPEADIQAKKNREMKTNTWTETETVRPWKTRLEWIKMDGKENCR